jgi:hypothetical protein
LGGIRLSPRGFTDAIADFDLREVFKLGKSGHHHDMTSHRSLCRSLDVIFGVGGLIMCVPPDIPPTPDFG